MSAANSNIVLLGAVAAAGLTSTPAAAHGPVVMDGSDVTSTASVFGNGIGSLASVAGLIRPALDGEVREALDAGALSLDLIGGTVTSVSNASGLAAGDIEPAVALTELLRGTDLPGQADLTAHAALVAEAVVMPAADFAAAPEAMTVVEARASGEVARDLAEALSDGEANALDALLDALPGNAPDPVAAPIEVWDMGQMGPFGSPHAAFAVETMAIHIDAASLA